MFLSSLLSCCWLITIYSIGIKSYQDREEKKINFLGHNSPTWHELPVENRHLSLLVLGAKKRKEKASGGGGSGECVASEQISVLPGERRSKRSDERGWVAKVEWRRREGGREEGAGGITSGISWPCDWWWGADESGSQCHSSIKYLLPLNCCLPSALLTPHTLSPPLPLFKLTSYSVQHHLHPLSSASSSFCLASSPLSPTPSPHCNLLPVLRALHL